MKRFVVVSGQWFRRWVGWKRLGIAASVTVIAIAVTTLLATLRSIDPALVVSALREISPPRVGLAALCVLGAFVTLTFYDLFALRTINKGHVPYRIAALSSFTSYSIGHNIGATVFTDGAIRFRIYSDWNLSPIDVAKIEFMQRFSKDYNIPQANLSRQTLKVLRSYEWPGNIRELRNLCERMSILLAGKMIEPENLPLVFTNKPVDQSANSNSPFILPEVGIKLDSLEADMIHQALIRTNGNRSKSARLLGLTRDTLLYRIQKHGLATH